MRSFQSKPSSCFSAGWWDKGKWIEGRACVRLPVKLYPFSIVEAAGGNTLCPVSSQTTLYSCTVCFIIIGVSRSFSATEPPMQFVARWSCKWDVSQLRWSTGKHVSVFESMSLCIWVFILCTIVFSWKINLLTGSSCNVSLEPSIKHNPSFLETWLVIEYWSLYF